jgi:Cu/Ag efflux pump CusA
MQSPVPAYILVLGGLVLGALVWTQQEHSLIPSFRETDVFVEVQGPPGASLQVLDDATAGLIQDLRKIPGVHNAAAQIGRALFSHELADVNAATVWVSIDPDADYEATLAAMGETINNRPGLKGNVETFLSKRMREGLTGEDKAISVRIYGQDLNILRAKAQEIRQALSAIVGIKAPEVDPQPEQQAIDVEVDLDKARVHGLKPGDVRRAASALLGGITVGSLFQEQKVFDVVIWGRPDIRRKPEDVQNLLIDTEAGPQVRLGDVAKISVVNTPSVIHRQGASRRIDVEAEIDGRSLAAVTEDVRRAVKEGAFPFEYHAEVLGEHVARQAALSSLYGYIIAAAIAIVLLLQAAFQSWRLAALIIICAPIAALGGFATAYLTSEVFSLGAVLGLFAVLVLAIRNMILQVRHFQALEVQNPGQGIGLVARGAAERLVPVLASAITIGLIAAPFAVLGNIAGLEILHPAAVVILGGLVTSTILTLFVIPSLYSRFVTKPVTAPPPSLAQGVA